MKLQINSYQNFNAYIPLSEFKGPILKLTEAEVIKVASIESEIGKLILEKDSILSYCSRSKNMSVKLFHNCSTQIHLIDTKIEFLRKQIKDIKINRITQQRAASK